MLTLADIRHRFVQANGIRMHVAEAGEGVPVVLCHGFPELWYSWRHQLRALGDQGFRVIAPDMRGYGETDAPADPAEYSTSKICADIAGLLDALEIERAVIVGHDWGGAHIWQFGLRFPARALRLVALNTPYAPPGPMRPTEAMHAAFGEGDRGYYVLYFQEPGQAEAEIEQDVRGNLAKMLHRADRAEDLWTFATLGGDGSGVFTRIAPEGTLLTDEELDVYAAAFERTGFRGGLNWYRAIDLTWEETRGLPDFTIRVPAMIITADRDFVLRPERAEAMRAWVPDLRIEHLKDSSHWTQQEKPDEVNALLVDFLGDLRVST